MRVAHCGPAVSGFSRMPGVSRSSSSSAAFTSSPPPNPTSEPLQPITRWQGRTIETGLRPFAAPIARTADGPADAVRLLAVGAGLAVGDPGERLPGCELERRAVEVEREVERRARAGEVLVELRGRCVENRRVTGREGLAGETDAVEAAVGPDHGAQSLVTRDEGERADGALVAG